jgi:hypothetical protein
VTSTRSVLHLVRGAALPAELRDAPAGDTLVFLGGVPSAPLPRCRILILGAGSGRVAGIRTDGLLELIFQCDAVVTW